MKKSVSLAIIAVVIVVGLIFVSLSISENPNEEKSLSDEKEIPINPVVEPKNFILKLEDTISTSSP